MPDMRNGGVVSAEHPHQHQHYGAAVQVPQGGGAVQADPNPCAGDPSVVGLRQGIPPHHYGGPPTGGQPAQGMPYPRFPPYDRMDIRNAGYYGAQQQMDGTQGYRPDSPTNMHMANTGAPNGHQTPVVYASCKLQAAAVNQNGVLGPGTGSPPLDGAQSMNTHHMGHHMQEQHPAQHHQQPAHHQQQQHMMYGAQQGAMHQQGPPHQQPPIPQPQQQGPPTPNNTASALPSPLYPWMRSQFGKLRHCRLLDVGCLGVSFLFLVVVG